MGKSGTHEVGKSGRNNVGFKWGKVWEKWEKVGKVGSDKVGKGGKNRQKWGKVLINTWDNQVTEK